MCEDYPVQCLVIDNDIIESGSWTVSRSIVFLVNKVIGRRRFELVCLTQVQCIALTGSRRVPIRRHAAHLLVENMAVAPSCM